MDGRTLQQKAGMETPAPQEAAAPAPVAAPSKGRKRPREADVLTDEVQAKLKAMDTATLTRHIHSLIDSGRANSKEYDFAQQQLYRKPRITECWMTCLKYLETDPPQQEEEEEDENDEEEEDDEEDEEEEEDGIEEAEEVDEESV